MGHIILTLALALADSDARLPVVESRADAADVNTVICTDDGRETLKQVVWLDYEDEGVVVVAWRIHAPGIEPVQVNGRWRSLFIDRDGTLRRVWVGAVRRTWWHEDYELLHRQAVHEDERRGLGR